MTPETFCEQFATFAEAPNGVAKLRELILQLAVQGKLGTHDENDEPAVVSHSEGNRIPDTKNRVLPKGWAIASLGDVARLRRGFDLPVGSRNTGDVPIFAANGIVGYHDEVGVAGPGVVTGRSGTIGKVHFVPGNYWPLNTSLYVENFHGNDPQFIVLLLRSVDLKRFSSQTAVPTLNRNVAHKAIVFVPPLAEQRRIVGKVDQLLGLCDELAARQAARREARSALVGATLDRLVSARSAAESPAHAHRLRDHFDRLFDTPTTLPQLRQAILQLAVQGQLVPQDPNDEPASVLLERIQNAGEQSEKTARRKRGQPSVDEDSTIAIPSGWVWTRLGDAFDVRDGTHDTPKYVELGFPLVTSKNLSSGALELTNVKLISEADHRAIAVRSAVERGDVLFAMIGSIGNPVVVETDTEFSIKNVALFKHRSAPDSCPHFLLHYLSHASAKMREQAAGGVQSFVSLGFLRGYPFPLPPLSEQKRIVSQVTELLSLCDALEAKLTQAESASTQLLSAAVHHLLNHTGETAS